VSLLFCVDRWRQKSALVVINCLFAVTAMAEGWDGKDVTIGGELHVINPATPIEATITKTPKELWRVGGEDDEDVLIGVISSIVVDDNGNVYMLDAQLSQIYVFTSDGAYVRTIGRDGGGPGEFRRSGHMFLTPRGNIAVLQRMPAKIIQLTPSGDALNNYAIPRNESGLQLALDGGGLSGGELVLAVTEFTSEVTRIRLNQRLLGIGKNGEITATFAQKERIIERSNPVVTEEESARILWATSGDGRVFTNNRFDAYIIYVYDYSGGLDRIIERDYKHHKRSEEEKWRRTPRKVFRDGKNRGQTKLVISDTARDIRAMYTRDDGTLWVMSSRGAADAPEGAFAKFDVYDRSGRFTRQETIVCSGNFEDDLIYFVKDRLYVVKGFKSGRDAMLAAFFNSDDRNDEDNEPEPLSVVCYDLSP
jgi:hypothetical protein